MKDILTNDTKKVLSEGSLDKIEDAFNTKMSLAVEAALAEQDSLYAEKLKELMRAIDSDHSSKLKRIVEAVDKNNASKLVKVVKRYEGELNSNAESFKNTLVESISDYLEEFVEESIPTEAIAEATKNNTAMKVLSNLRSVLAIDTALMQESVKEAVVDGRTQIETLAERVQELEKENAEIKESYITTKTALVLENKTSKLPEQKKQYIKRVLSDKSPEFIEENFDYTLRLFEKKERERLVTIKEEAFDERTVKADVPVVKESATASNKTTSNPYVEELTRMK